MNTTIKAPLAHRVTTRISPIQLSHLSTMPCPSAYIRTLIDQAIKAANDE